MWHNGLLDFSIWQTVLATLLLTHVTIVGVTVYLHRHSAHRALELHPVLGLFFRTWLWLTTGMTTKAWTAIHRKHHAKCESEEDPHSPVVLGLPKVLWGGAELYRAGIDDRTLEKYGKGTPDDWLERNLFSIHTKTGLGVMLIADVALFGPIGITVWAVQMSWIPVLAAGVINGVGHHTGYRNFEVPDASTNIVPWGILIGGEELHNNHHTYPSSAKLSSKWWEIDIGWGWIKLFSALGLARVKRLPPVIHEVSGKAVIDGDTTLAVINNRFQIMARYAKTVVVPLVAQERARADSLTAERFDRAKAVICRDRFLIDAAARQHLRRLLDQSQVLAVIYEKRLELQALWENRTATSEELLTSLTDWCRRAEESGIGALADFAHGLKTCSTSPAPAG